MVNKKSRISYKIYTTVIGSGRAENRFRADCFKTNSDKE